MQKIERFRKTVLKRLEIEGNNDDNRQLIKLVKEAIISDHWGHGKTIMIGRTDKIRDFSTLIFHEAGHDILEVGSTPEEEERCHDYSKKTCERLNLPFDEELTNVCREFVRFTNEHRDNPDIFIRKINSFSIKHKKTLSIY